MPRTRSNVDRDAKADEILDAAETLFMGDGYPTTTMAEIARRVGVTVNVIYWYFPSKDAVLAAVLDRRLQRGVEALMRPKRSLRQRVRAALRQLDEVAPLTAVVHDRARHSTEVAQVHSAFHEVANRYLRDSLTAGGLANRDAQRAADALIAMVEGMHLHDTERDSAHRDRVILWALDRFTA